MLENSDVVHEEMLDYGCKGKVLSYNCQISPLHFSSFSTFNPSCKRLFESVTCN